MSSLLADLIAKLDMTPSIESLRPLVKACDAAIEASLDMSRNGAAEPAPPTRSELASLLDLLGTANRRNTVEVLRQIRRAIGRLDECIG